MSTTYQPQQQPWLNHPSHMHSPFQHESQGTMQHSNWGLPVSMSNYQMPQAIQHPTHHNQPHQSQSVLPPMTNYHISQGMHQSVSQAPSQSLRPASSQGSLHSVPPSPGLPMNQSQVMSQSHNMSHGLSSNMHHPGHPPPTPLTMASMPSSMTISSPGLLPPYRTQGPPPIPHQVVGQQGIRGVLPRTSGDNSSAEEVCEPEQGSDGLWKCKLCGKTYRHAKHLRRHHARHTGETPYECHLCGRRFGRSDVLKRHYHKCATRRGVPVGDHLAGQRGHPRRQTAGGPVRDVNSQGRPSPMSEGQQET